MKKTINSVYAVQIYNGEGNIVNVKSIFSKIDDANKCADEFNKYYSSLHASVIEYNVHP